MRWHDLLFAHWPADAAQVRALLPAGLELDRFDGDAWIGAIPFRMSRVRVRGLFGLAFPELNLRTYVRAAGKPGVWFFSLDAASRLAVRTARLGFGLPYFDARMRCDRSGNSVEYESERTHRGAPPASFRARYSPRGAAFASRPGSLEHFLTERYCLFALRKGRLVCGEIDHARWPLQPAEAELDADSLLAASGVKCRDVAPLLHFAERLDVRAWAAVPLD